ncbi:hypothetical protein AA3271_1112 [Gluconobacter japonicus NBRC 3271]|nr:hypothetical protein AA3271_1112 [Gluconobacter japonicus NBRC 3271]
MPVPVRVACIPEAENACDAAWWPLSEYVKHEAGILGSVSAKAEDAKAGRAVAMAVRRRVRKDIMPSVLVVSGLLDNVLLQDR